LQDESIINLSLSINTNDAQSASPRSGLVQQDGVDQAATHLQL